MSGAIAERLGVVRKRIESAARRSGREPGEVRLVAVSKTMSLDLVMEAYEAGAVDLGENRAQELRDKAAATGTPAGLRWHFIGHLQTNKARLVTGTAALIHSVDRFGLGEAIARHARSMGIVQEVLIEIDLAGEASKHGVTPAAAPDLAASIDGLDGVAVAGVMAIPPIPTDPESSRPYFAELRELSELVRKRVPGATEISMGMTRDFEVAVEEGATIVRVGEAIFGPRSREGP